MPEAAVCDVGNNYTKTVNLDNPVLGVGLNGDTTVRSILANKISFKQYVKISIKFHFNITKDSNVAEKESSYSYQNMDL